MSLRASAAEGRTLLISLRRTELEKERARNCWCCETRMNQSGSLDNQSLAMLTCEGRAENCRAIRRHVDACGGIVWVVSRAFHTWQCGAAATTMEGRAEPVDARRRQDDDVQAEIEKKLTMLKRGRKQGAPLGERPGQRKRAHPVTTVGPKGLCGGPHRDVGVKLRHPFRTLGTPTTHLRESSWRSPSYSFPQSAPTSGFSGQIVGTPIPRLVYLNPIRLNETAIGLGGEKRRRGVGRDSDRWHGK